MRGVILQRALGALLPGGILVGAWVAALALPGVGERLNEVAPAVGVGAALAGLCIAAFFRRGRILVSLAAVALGAWAHAAALADPNEVFQRYATAAVALLLPLNLGLVAWLPERGAFSSGTLRRLAAVAAQAAVAALVWGAYWERAVAWVAGRAGPAAALSAAWVPMPRAAAALFGLAALALAVRVTLLPAPIEAGSLWAVAACFVALQAGAAGPAWFALAAATLTLAALLAAAGLAYRDALTGLPSRRAFDDALAHLPDRFAVAMVDVDHFKRINDTYGHDVGDQVLRMVASRLAEACGPARAYRTGGEEFAILFPGSSAAQAMERAEAVRRSFAEGEFALRAKDRPRRRPRRPPQRKPPAHTLTVTVSIGVAARSARGAPAAAAVAEADEALLFAKRAGRNRVIDFA